MSPSPAAAAAAVCALAVCLAVAESTVAKVWVSSTVVNTVDTGFASWNIDSTANRGFFWRNLSDPHLLYMAANFHTGYLRFGGTGNDELTYDMDNGCRGSDTPCLNATMFRGLVNLAQVSSRRLIFGLNIKTRTPPNASHPHGVWDPAMATALLEYAVQNGMPIHGVELGNEENEFLTPQETAADFWTLCHVLARVYPDATHRPLLFGPDPHSFKGVPVSTEKLDFLRGFAEQARDTQLPLHGVTHHEYIEVGNERSLQPSVLDMTLSIAFTVNGTVRSVLPDTALYAGEIGPHNGGSPGCDTAPGRWTAFADSFWYVDAMGSKAKAGYQGFFRQDFVGIDYGLVDCRTYEPFPDFYAGVLWSKTMGSAVLSTTSSNASYVRAYAHCANDGDNGGGVSLAIVNLAADTTTVAVAMDAAAPNGGTQRDEYVLTAPHNNTNGTAVQLNGDTLVFDTAAWKLPALNANQVTNDGTVTLPGHSVSFVTFPAAGMAPCM